MRGEVKKGEGETRSQAVAQLRGELPYSDKNIAAKMKATPHIEDFPGEQSLPASDAEEECEDLRKILSIYRRRNRFAEYLWPLLEERGWHCEKVPRGQVDDHCKNSDQYYVPRGVLRKAPYQNRVHYFDSVRRLIIHLYNNEQWARKELRDQLMTADKAAKERRIAIKEKHVKKSTATYDVSTRTCAWLLVARIKNRRNVEGEHMTMQEIMATKWCSRQLKVLRDQWLSQRYRSMPTKNCRSALFLDACFLYFGVEPRGGILYCASVQIPDDVRAHPLFPSIEGPRAAASCSIPKAKDGEAAPSLLSDDLLDSQL